MNRLRIAVLGGGHLGSIHARLVQQLPGAELSAIVEPDAARAAELERLFDCEVTTRVEQFVSRAVIDGVVIAAPTSLHHALGVQLLRRGIHCLIEKPLASTPAECRALVAASRQGNCVLQVGHVERFNPVWTTNCQRIGEPRLIDAVREGPLTFRSMDAGVVLDLMIHDIDLILSLVKSRVVNLQARGFSWTGPAEDIAHAQLTFANGCVAKLSASRVSSTAQRRMRIFGTNWLSDVDFAERRCHLVEGPMRHDWQSRSYSPEERTQLVGKLYRDVLTRHDLGVPDGNPILDELCDFVTSISTGSSPIVTGEDGLAAVEIAYRVIQQIHGHDAEPVFRKAG